MKPINENIKYNVQSRIYGCWHTGCTVHWKIHQAMSDGFRRKQIRTMKGLLLNRIGRRTKQQLENDFLNP